MWKLLVLMLPVTNVHNKSSQLKLIEVVNSGLWLISTLWINWSGKQNSPHSLNHIGCHLALSMHKCVDVGDLLYT